MPKIKYHGPSASYTIPGAPTFRKREASATQLVTEEVAEAAIATRQFSYVKEQAAPEETPVKGRKGRAKGGVRIHDEKPKDGIPDLPAAGFSTKDAAATFARTVLELEVDTDKALKTLNAEIAAAYVAKFQPERATDDPADDLRDDDDTELDTGNDDLTSIRIGGGATDDDFDDDAVTDANDTPDAKDDEPSAGDDKE